MTTEEATKLLSPRKLHKDSKDMGEAFRISHNTNSPIDIPYYGITLHLLSRCYHTVITSELLNDPEISWDNMEDAIRITNLGPKIPNVMQDIIFSLAMSPLPILLSGMHHVRTHLMENDIDEDTASEIAFMYNIQKVHHLLNLDCCSDVINQP